MCVRGGPESLMTFMVASPCRSEITGGTVVIKLEVPKHSRNYGIQWRERPHT